MNCVLCGATMSKRETEDTTYYACPKCMLYAQKIMRNENAHSISKLVNNSTDNSSNHTSS